MKRGGIAGIIFRFSSLLLALPAGAGQLTVDIFPMVHPRPEGEVQGQGMYQEVLESQYAAMAYLDSVGSPYVFLESAREPWYRSVELNEQDPSKQVNVITSGSLKILFPEIPRYFDYLSEVQKNIIATEGLGVTLMARLGRLEAILPTVSSDATSRIPQYSLEQMVRFGRINAGTLEPVDANEARAAKEMMSNIFERREKMALEEIRKFAAKNPEIARVSLFFGGLHDFMKYKKDYPELRFRIVNTKYYLQKNIVDILAKPEPRYQEYYYDVHTGLMVFLSPF